MWLLVVIPLALAAALAIRWHRTPYRPGTVALPFAPPLAPLLAICVGSLGEMVWPTDVFAAPVWRWVGAALVFAGMASLFAAMRTMFRAGADPNPGRVVPAIVAHGIFARSRNPMYVAFLLIAAGSGIGSDALWTLALTAAAWLALRYAIVAREEDYLSQRFPEAFAAYRSRVRRWI